MAGIDSLTFDLADGSLREQSEVHRAWMTPDGVAHTLRYRPGPPEWPFDLTDPDAAAAFYGRQCAEFGGVMLSMDVLTADGVEALRGLFKYRAPVPVNLAMYYVGILWLPFQGHNYQINIEAMETRTTGAREAAVMLIEGDAWPRPSEDAEPVVVASAEELLTRLGSSPVRQLPSDRETYDRSFPDHPLSRVRARMARAIASLRLDPAVRELEPYRVGRGR